MDRDRFAQSYRRPKSGEVFLGGNESLEDVLQPFTKWGVWFGDELYHAITDESYYPDQLTASAALNQYANEDNALAASSKIESLLTQEREKGTLSAEDTFAVLQRHNFHVMSQAALFMWTEMLIGGRYNERERERCTNYAMLGLAISSLSVAEWREDNASITNSHRYFGSELAHERRFIDGVMTEIDTAMVLLEVTRKDPSILFVPAPPRFEASDRRANNADFIVYSRATNEVAGIQTKTNVRDEDRQTYDTSKIALVDGTVDLNNQIWTRTRAGASDTKPVSWPGLVAADFLNGIKLHGRRSLGFEEIDTRWLLEHKRRAGILLQPPYDTNGRINGRLNLAHNNVKRIIKPYLGIE